MPICLGVCTRSRELTDLENHPLIWISFFRAGGSAEILNYFFYIDLRESRRRGDGERLNDKENHVGTEVERKGHWSITLYK